MTKTCLLCGHEGPDVRVGLAAWKKPIDGEVFTSIPRCVDKTACRDRVEADSQEWELLDKVAR